MADNPLDAPLLQIKNSTRNTLDEWSIRNAVEGVQIFGGIGSGKTSGSGAVLARKYLEHGFGGLVLTAKRDETELWKEYCRTYNRLDDLVIITPGGDHTFNFLDYEFSRSGKGAGLTDNIVNVLRTVIRAGHGDGQGRTNEGFWEDALDMLLFNTVDLATLAYGQLTIADLYQIVKHLPTSLRDVVPPAPNSRDPFASILYKAKLNVGKRATARKRMFEETGQTGRTYTPNRDPEIRLYSTLSHYFQSDFPGLSDKTRSVIEHSFYGFLFRLIRDPIRSLLCSETATVSPDDSLRGKIILIDLPVKLYDKVGRDAQILFKYIWQRAMERRDVRDNARPVFLWADEAQNFLHEHDIDYQATARSSRVCTVYLTQNIPNYYTHMGGRDGEYRVKSFLGTMGTKMFHANADMVTNNYAAELFGKAMVEVENYSVSYTKEYQRTEGKSQIKDFIVPPEAFTRMRTGGPDLNYKVDVYIHRQGIPFFDGGRNFLKTTFTQNH